MEYNTAPIIVFVILIICFAVKSLCCRDDEESEQEDLVEGLSDYYEALKIDDIITITGQEEYYRNNFDLKRYSNE